MTRPGKLCVCICIMCLALLIGTASADSTSTMTKEITVTGTIPAPVANFLGTPTSGTAPLTVIFTDSSTNTPTAWNWSFGDGSLVNITDKNPVHTYTTAGTYTVSLNATNAGGSNTKTATNYITVTGITPAQVPVASFTLSPVTGVVPLTVTFKDTSTGTPNAWNWSFGDGSTSTDPNPSHMYNNNGVYSVTLIATNSFGDSSPYIAVKNISVTTPVNQSETTFQGVVLNPSIYPNKKILFNITDVRNAGGTVTNESSTLVDYKPSGWQSIFVTGTNVTNDAKYVLADTVTSVKMTTYPLTKTFESVGTVQSQFVLDQITLTQGASFDRAVVPGANNSVTSQFQHAVQVQEGATLSVIGYTVEIPGAAPFNANKTGTNSVFVNLSASHDWVMAHGGTGAIRILHLPENPPAEVLTTTYAGGDGTTDYFTAYSNGLSIFGLAGVTASPAPAPASGPVSDSGTTISVQSGQSGNGIATANEALAGQTVSYSFGNPTDTYPVSIQSVSFVPSETVPQSQCVVQQQGPSSEYGLTGRPAAYESIDISSINQDVITSGTIHFSVLASWLSEKQIDPANVVLLRNHDLVWTELPTSFDHTDGNNYYYYSDTPGFSYFAVSEGHPTPAKVTSQTTVSLAEKGEPTSLSVTGTAITTPGLTKPAPESIIPPESTIPVPDSTLYAVGIILICASGAIYFIIRKIPHKTRVLIVDDEPQICEVLSLILGAKNYKTIKAFNGEECLSLLKNKRNHPDAILLDITMYPMDGWKTLEKLKKDPALRSIPVLMLTGKQLAPEDAKRYGICIEDYIHKPVLAHELYGAIEYVLNRKKKIAGEIQMAIRAGNDKTLVCEYAKLAKQTDVEKKLLERIRTTYTRVGKTKEEIRGSIEDLANEIQRREETMIQLRQRFSGTPVSYPGPDKDVE